ncbi:MAG TPA: hypothetical protein VF624_12870 [Tepidisphaeraceae bacterium]
MMDFFASQTFQGHDIMVVALLIVLEGTLSVDNALVLGLLAKRLPPGMRKRALTYGLIGAFVFRVAAIGFAAWLLHWPVVKLLGGGYLIYVALNHFFFAGRSDDKHRVKIGSDGHAVLHDDDEPLTNTEREQEIDRRLPFPDKLDPSRPGTVVDVVTPETDMRRFSKFWPTVIVIELTDVAFAVDSILAALAFIPPNPDPSKTNPKLWVVLLGGFIGVVLMRVAAVVFIRLLERFPRFETAAYLLVTVIGLKLVIDWAGNRYFGEHTIDFHSPTSVPFWAFWISMIICFGIGFMGGRKPGTEGGGGAKVAS